MKKTTNSLFSLSLVFSGLFLMSLSARGQEVAKLSPPLPDNIHKIVSFSCMPCHGSKGGMMARTKLNFAEWTQYSAEKQKEKAAKIYSELNKGKMPPKDARESRPEIIPAKDQIDEIKKWADSFPGESK